MTSSDMPSKWPGQSDIGLSGERTSLAWTRIGLALVAVPAGLAAYSVQASLLISTVASTLATAAGLLLLVSSLRAPRAETDMVGQRLSVVDGRRVLLAGVVVVLIGVASLALVLQST